MTCVGRNYTVLKTEQSVENELKIPILKKNAVKT